MSTNSRIWRGCGEMMASSALKDMIAEFSRHWDGKVTRTRDAVELIQKI